MDKINFHIDCVDMVVDKIVTKPLSDSYSVDVTILGRNGGNNTVLEIPREHAERVLKALMPSMFYPDRDTQVRIMFTARLTEVNPTYGLVFDDLYIDTFEVLE